MNDGKSVMNGLDTNGEAKTPTRKSSCNFLRLFAPPPAPSNSPVSAANAEPRIVPESSSPTSLSPVYSLWPLASRFISNNGDGPWPQVASAAASSAPPEMSSNSSEVKPSESGEMSAMSRLHPAPESSSSEEKSMEVDETPSSSDQMPSTASLPNKSTNSAESGMCSMTANVFPLLEVLMFLG